MSEVKYPQHEKLKLVQHNSQMIHDFVLEFLQSKGIFLAESHEKFDHQIFQCSKKLTDLVAEYFEIDLKALEKEKEQMIEEIRQAQTKGG